MRKNFALCLNDKYVPYACVTVKSIAEHEKAEDEIYIYVVSDFISADHRKTIKEVAGKTNVEILIVGDDKLADLPETALSWSIYAWYRILLPDILPSVHKILYLDCDVLVNDDLDDLFSIDMNGKSIAACVDIETHNPELYKRLEYDANLQYVCSGVLLMNLDRWRETDRCTHIIEYVKEHPEKLVCPDQDAINYVCRNDKMLLSPKYGVMVPYFRYEWFMREYYTEMPILIEKPCIIHFAAYQPWIYIKDKSMHSYLWWRTFWRLHSFPEVVMGYIESYMKYWIKMVLIRFKLAKPGTRFYFLDMYYYHGKIRAKDVYKRMRAMQNS